MENWYDKMVKMLQLNGKGDSSQKAYARAVRMLVDHYHKDPDLITEEELQNYFLYRRNTSKWAPNTMRICHAGIRFFYENVLRRDWHIFGVLGALHERRLPAIFSVEETYRLLGCVKTLHNYVFLRTVYSCGLRLQEGLCLEIFDIDKDRMMIHVHRGKGAKDRYVPLPHSTLDLLRRYWRTHRHPRLLFPAVGRNHKGAPNAQNPMAKASVQGAFRAAKAEAGINKKNTCIHTLRHCYATHCLEAGVNIHAIQRYLGHSQLETTMLYLHLTHKGQEDAYKVIDHIMGGPKDENHK